MIEHALDIGSIVLQEAQANEFDVEASENMAAAAAAIAVGLAALGSGYAERGIGAAAVGAIAEDDDMLGPGILLTVLPETLVIFAIVVIFLV